MSRSNRRKRSILAGKTGRVNLEGLEPRRLMCAIHKDYGPVVDEAPQLAGVASSRLIPDPADIIWVNKAATTTGGAGDTDQFGATFGTLAPTARAVVEAVITSYERMIGSFDYAAAGQTYSVSVTMDGGFGFGAGAGLTFAFGNKPKGGEISMQRGNNDGIANNDNGWFLDPTPLDDSEFLGAIVNGFSGDATGGGPASGKSDFFTVVAAEMTHCMGLFGNALPGWAARTTNTGVADTAEGGGVGKFWTFQGASIKHLLSSNNGGPGGTDTGSAVHSAGPGVTVPFGGDNYIGAQDQGNAVYEVSRRYLINNTFALMFKDAYAYLSVNPDQFGTMYSVRNQSTNVITVRGGDFVTGGGLSSDVISITRSGSTITVSVDVTNDVAGTGALAGAGNLPAFVTNYDISQVSSISINSSASTDTIMIGANVGVPITVDGGTGTDTVSFEGTSGADTMSATAAGFSSGLTTVTVSNVENLVMNGNDGADTLNLTGGASGRPITVNGGNGADAINIVNATGTTHPQAITVNGGSDASVDVLTINDAALANTATYTVTSTMINKNNSFGGATYSAMESVSILGESGANTFAVSSTATGVPVTIDGGVTLDTYNVNETSANAPVVIVSGAGADALNVNVDATGAAEARFVNTVSLGALTIGAGGLANMTANGSRVLVVTGALSITGANARIDLNDNDMIRDYTGGTQMPAVSALLSAGRAGGAWANLGITSSAAKNASPKNTTLGAMEASDYKLIYGAGAMFDGQTIDTTAILIKYTYYGDADFNGQVNFDDYSRADAGFNGNKSGWINGDFDNNGSVNFDDYSLIDLAFNTQSGVLIQAKPGAGKLGFGSIR